MGVSIECSGSDLQAGESRSDGEDDAELVELLGHKTNGSSALHADCSRNGRSRAPSTVLRRRRWLRCRRSMRNRPLDCTHCGRFTASGLLRRCGEANADGYGRNRQGWTIQLLADDGRISPELTTGFIRLARSDPSAVVRLYLASAVQRVPDSTAWQLIEALAQHGEDREDRNLPYLLWQGMAPLMSGTTRGLAHCGRRPLRPPRPGTGRTQADFTRTEDEPRGRGSQHAGALALPNLDHAFAIAERTKIPQLADWIYWYAATLEGGGLNRVIARLDRTQGEDQRRLLAGIALAVETRGSLTMPPSWKQAAPRLYSAKDARIQREAERLAAVFGDDSMFPRLRKTLSTTNADFASRTHAFTVLSRALDRASLPVFLRLLDDGAFRAPPSTCSPDSTQRIFPARCSTALAHSRQRNAPPR